MGEAGARITRGAACSPTTTPNTKQAPGEGGRKDLGAGVRQGSPPLGDLICCGAFTALSLWLCPQGALHRGRQGAAVDPAIYSSHEFQKHGEALTKKLGQPWSGRLTGL